MPNTRPARATVWIAVALGVTSGCATARNYEDPGAPVYVGGHSAGGHSTETLRIVSFNLKWGRETTRAAALLSRPGPLQGADLIVLQEMDGPGTERLAQALGLGYVYVPSAVHPVPRQDFGVALLSPWPLDTPRKLVLPHQSHFRKLRRSAAVATLQSPLGPIRVYGVHLESPVGAGGQVRRDQVRAVVADTGDWPGPVVVAGDFNGRGGPRELTRAGFHWTTEAVENTAGPFDFDHVLARGLCPAGPGAAGTAKTEAGTSDHRPVWALLAACPDKSPRNPARWSALPPIDITQPWQ
ncbi:MAG TPA: endonuclease/exonuclease/phosphatase family protein [Vicinamibacteria bacterium]